MPLKRNICRCLERIKLVEETSDMYHSTEAQAYISSDMNHPNKRWVQQIASQEKEQEHVKLIHKDFVLLPDTKNIYRRWATVSKTSSTFFNWMIIVTDPTLRNIRDLRACHIPLLQNIMKLGIKRVRTDFPQILEEDIMIYANYPPSVHRLHFHICCPFFYASAFDAFRMHPLRSIINNLVIDPEYYAISTFTVPLHENAPLLEVYRNIDQDKLPGNVSSSFLPQDQSREILPVS